MVLDIGVRSRIEGELDADLRRARISGSVAKHSFHYRASLSSVNYSDDGRKLA
jgi:hypothetical protein